MDLHNLPSRLIEALAQHIPASSHWVPLAVVGGVFLLGLICLLRGGRLAPGLTASALTLAGAAGGALITRWLPGPVWPVALIGATAGLLAGLMLFRFWLALQVAGLLVAAALMLYSSRIMVPLSAYSSKGFNAATGEISLQAPTGGAGGGAAGLAQAGEIWQYLSQQVPDFQLSVAAIVLSCGVAGLLVGGLLPRVARSLWAATIGTGLVGLAVLLGAQYQWPAAVSSIAAWTPYAAIAVWVLALVWNFVDLLRPRTKRVVEAAPVPVAA